MAEKGRNLCHNLGKVKETSCFSPSVLRLSLIGLMSMGLPIALPDFFSFKRYARKLFHLFVSFAVSAVNMLFFILQR